MKHGSLFSGIGGFDLAAEWMGWENVFHCEWNEFGKRVLKYYWPEAISYDDITKTDFTIHRGAIDILTGGFPCQPYSVAGKQKGNKDTRHLWPEMLRAIREIKPKYVVGENVGGLVSWNKGMVFEQVQADLESEGYEVQPIILPACSVGGWHRRDRVWFLAHSKHGANSSNTKQKGKKSRVSKKCWSERFAREFAGTDYTLHTDNWGQRTKRQFKEAVPQLKGIQRREDIGVYAIIEGRPDLSTPVLCRSYDGIPDGVERVKAYGNAVVPQVVYKIFKVIEEFDKLIIEDNESIKN